MCIRDRGYTNGYTATLWRPNQTVSLNQYTEFLLRALGYSSVTNTDLSDTPDRAVSAGLINSKAVSYTHLDVYKRQG